MPNAAPIRAEMASIATCARVPLKVVANMHRKLEDGFEVAVFRQSVASGNDWLIRKPTIRPKTAPTAPNAKIRFILSLL